MPGFRLRLYILTALILVGFGTLLSTLHEFQIVRRDEFLALVPGSYTVTIREPGIRGEITDRNGIPLARNLRDYEISFNLEEIVNAYIAQNQDNPTIQRYVQKNGLPRPASEIDIVHIVNKSIIKPLSKLGLAKNYRASTLRTHYITHQGLIPFTYRSDLTYEEFSRIAEHNLQFPGVTLGIRPRRQYPYGTLASHILGYIKQWEKGDIPEADKRIFNHYVGEEKGIAGIEATMDSQLRGLEGRKTVLKNEKGHTIGLLDYTKPSVGADVTLTIDARLQFLLENTLRRAGRAAGVIMDVRTGEVLAMASVPDFDPNAFVPSISAARLKEYNENKQLSPFTNRAISSYAPGSTMKLPTAIAGAAHGISNRSFTCTGGVAYGKTTIACWIKQKGGAHGTLTLESAIQKSCNPYFMLLANTIGPKAMVDALSLVGFGKKTGIELPREEPGILPGSRAWLNSSPNAVLTPPLNAMLSIGQADTLATPLQLAAMTSTIANGGKYYRPRIVRKITAENGKILLPDTPELKVDLLRHKISEKDLAKIRQGMWKAVNEAGGTAGKIKMADHEIAAKTGTAQTIDNGKKSHNSWVVSFAPYDQPRYAVVVLSQDSGSGGAVCGPLVNIIYTGIFAQENGMRLPLKPQTEYKGHLKRIEAIEPIKDVLAAIEATEIPTSETSTPSPNDSENIGETGDEIGDIQSQIPQPNQTPDSLPKPTITEEYDREGQVIPRATPVNE